MPYRVAIGPSSFAAEDETPKTILKQAGINIVPNPYGRRLTEDEVIKHLDGVDGLIAGLEPLNRKVMQAAPKLKAIARVGIGMDNLDLDAAKEFNISVSNTPDGPTEAVAELCLTVLLALQRQHIPLNNDMHKKKWQKRIGQSIQGTNVLLVGYGRIGRRFGDLLRFLSANVLVTDPAIDPIILKNGEKLVPLNQGLEEAEIISIHANCKETLLGKHEFQRIRKGVILLNSARGELIDEDALIEALDEEIVNAAWFDAFQEEPYFGRLTDYEQVLLTPHISTYTQQCRRSMEETAVRNLLRDLDIDLK